MHGEMNFANYLLLPTHRQRMVQGIGLISPQRGVWCMLVLHHVYNV